MLKRKVDYKKNELPAFLEQLKKVIDEQEQEVVRAIIDKGKQGRRQDFEKGVSTKIVRLRVVKNFKPRPQIDKIVRSTHAHTLLFQIYVIVIL